MKKLSIQPIDLILVSFICLSLIVLWLPNRKILSEFFDIPRARYIYQHSQYNLKNSEFYGNIDDDLLFTYTGYEYALGANPSQFNFEVPYLIKYLYGFSIVVFGNPFWVQLFFSLSLLAVVYQLGFLVTNSTSLGLLASLLVSLDHLYRYQALHTLLDLPHAFFICLCGYFFLKYLQTQKLKNIFWASIFLGAVATTKLFISAVVLYLIMAVLVKKKLKVLLYLTLPAIVVYLVTFSAFFFHQPNPIDFINLHIQIAKLYRSYLPQYPWGEILRILVIGKWQTWWGQGIITVPEWSLLWPISFVGTIASFIFSYMQKNKLLLFLSVFSLAYLFSNMFHVVFPRYILSILPLMVICLLYSAREVFYVYRHRWQRG